MFVATLVLVWAGHVDTGAWSVRDDVMDEPDDEEVEFIPVFQPTPRNVTVSLGDRAVLRCRVENLGTRTVCIYTHNWACGHLLKPNQTHARKNCNFPTQPNQSTHIIILPARQTCRKGGLYIYYIFITIIHDHAKRDCGSCIAQSAIVASQSRFAQLWPVYRLKPMVGQTTYL